MSNKIKISLIVIVAVVIVLFIFPGIILTAKMLITGENQGGIAPDAALEATLLEGGTLQDVPFPAESF